MNSLERVADRAYLIGVLAVGLWGGSFIAARVPNKAEEATARANQVAAAVDANMKEISNYAGGVNGRLAAIEQKLGIPQPAAAPAKK